MTQKQYTTGANVGTSKAEEASLTNRNQIQSSNESSITPVTSEPKLNDPTHSNKLQTFIIRTVWTL